MIILHLRSKIFENSLTSLAKRSYKVARWCAYIGVVVRSLTKTEMKMVHASTTQGAISLDPSRGCGLKDGRVVEENGTCPVVEMGIIKEFQRTLP